MSCPFRMVLSKRGLRKWDCNLLQKKMLSSSYHRQFSKINPHLEARQAIAVFTLRDKKTHETKEGHFIVKN